MTSKKLFKCRAPLPVAQEHAKNQPRWIVVNKDREFLLFLETGDRYIRDRIPISLELTEGRQAKVTVKYDENRTFDLIELESPATILGAFDLMDDPDGRFTKLCETALAIWKVVPPEVASTFDLLIASAKLGMNSTSYASDKILWWKVAGQEKQQPPKPCAITDPSIIERLLQYELIDTEVKEFEVIRKYRKLEVKDIDDLTIARKARATHKDRNGNFYKATPSGVIMGRVENGSIEWKTSPYYHMPETTEVL